MNQPRGPFCQSCSMPMSSPEYFGTDEKGFRINDYCIHCFKDGKFTNPNITMEEMIEFVSNIMVEKQNIPTEQAKQISRSFIPMLKRWKKNNKN